MITKGQMLLIFCRILLTNSLRKCMVISRENVYVDIGTRRVAFFLDIQLSLIFPVKKSHMGC